MDIKTMTLYLAGPIDDVSGEEATGWREEVAKIAPAGVLLFDPTRAWWGASQVTAAAVDYGNRVAIHASDGVLVNLSGAGRGFGTMREVEFARNQVEKPVAVAHGTQEIVSLCAHDLILRFTVDEALDALIEQVRQQQDAPHPFAHLFGGQQPPATDDD